MITEFTEPSGENRPTTPASSAGRNGEEEGEDNPEGDSCEIEAREACNTGSLDRPEVSGGTEAIIRGKV